MNCFSRKFARKQAKLLTFNLKVSDTSIVLAEGQFKAYGVTNKDFLTDPFNLTPENYIFEKTDAQIKEVSDFANKKLSIPLTSEDFDQETNFWVVAIYDFGDYARGKVIVEYVLSIDDAN